MYLLGRDNQKIVPNFTFFANDISVIEESSETINFKHELWRERKRVFTSVQVPLYALQF